VVTAEPDRCGEERRGTTDGARLVVLALDDVQAAYDEALQRVLADLPAGLVDATITVDFTSPDALPYGVRMTNGRGHRTSLVFTEDAEEATVILADQIQADVFETLWSACWPDCRWHAHPATARVVDGQAAWVCGRSGYKIAAIGEMSQVKVRRRRGGE
jgi:hypothetical protein